MSDKIQKIKKEFEKRIESMNSCPFKTAELGSEKFDKGELYAYKQILQFIDTIDSLPEEPKFKVGDMVISTNNSSLTYKVLQVGLQNELGKLDYEVEIFTNGKPGIKVGNTFKEHNIRLICCDRMDEWGKLFSEEHNENLEEEISNYIKDNFFGSGSMGFLSNRTKGELDSVDVVNIARHFAEWQKDKMKEVLQTEYEKGRFNMQQEMIKDAVEGEVVYQIGSSVLAPTDIRYKVMSDRVYIPNVKLGDKVKIIIVNEDQQ